MIDPLLPDEDGATPLGEDEREGLKLSYVNVNYWLEHETYVRDEIAARFHHKLVFIHPYPNGNGRHARLAADILLKEH